jgi:hypothetical protein
MPRSELDVSAPCFRPHDVYDPRLLKLSGGLVMRWLAIGLIFLTTTGVAAAQPRNDADAKFAPAPKYKTRAQCEADPDKSRSCCDFTERLRYVSRRRDGMLISELGPEMPTRLICHDPDFER